MFVGTSFFCYTLMSFWGIFVLYESGDGFNNKVIDEEEDDGVHDIMPQRRLELLTHGFSNGYSFHCIFYQEYVPPGLCLHPRGMGAVESLHFP